MTAEDTGVAKYCACDVESVITAVAGGISSRSGTAYGDAVTAVARSSVGEVATENRCTRKIGIDLEGVVSEISIGLVGGAFRDPDGVVRSTTRNCGGIQRSGEAEGVVATLAVNLGAVSVGRKIDGIVTGSESDDVALRTAVVNDVITAEGVDGAALCFRTESRQTRCR